MTQKLKRLSGAVLVLQALPTMAQPSPSASSASQPPPNPIAYPVDPTWLVITLIVGLIIGYLIGAKRAATKASASHA